MITNKNGLEAVNNILVPNEQYNISLRDEPWDNSYEIHHITYNALTNSWKMSPWKLKKLFKLVLVDQERIRPTSVSVIQVVREINKIKVPYSSSLFTLSNQINMNKLCQNWIKRDKRKAYQLKNFFPCPCSLKQAKNDPNYERDVMCTSQETHPFWASENCKANKGAYECVISKSTMYVCMYMHTYVANIPKIIKIIGYMYVATPLSMFWYAKPIITVHTYV